MSACGTRALGPTDRAWDEAPQLCQTVEALWGDTWFPGSVCALLEDGRVQVLWDAEPGQPVERSNVTVDQLRPPVATTHTKFKVGQAVEAR